MRPWQMIVPEEDRKIYAKGGFGKTQPVGVKVALMIVDVVESFVGSKPGTAPELIREYRTSCGEYAWAAIPHIQELLAYFRHKNLTVVYTKGNPLSKAFCGSSTKGNSFKETIKLHSTNIIDEVKPLESEFIVEKTKASAFFATPLSTYFRAHGIDTLYIVGTTTSGCIRSSVVDAFSHGFNVFVVEEGCFDRSNFSHLVNLYEMDQKYADVIQIETVYNKLKDY